MTTQINVTMPDSLHTYLLQGVESGFYENIADYLRDIVRKEMLRSDESWKWLENKLMPAMQADESEYFAVSADDVIDRNIIKG